MQSEPVYPVTEFDCMKVHSSILANIYLLFFCHMSASDDICYLLFCLKRLAFHVLALVRRMTFEIKYFRNTITLNVCVNVYTPVQYLLLHTRIIWPTCIETEFHLDAIISSWCHFRVQGSCHSSATVWNQLTTYIQLQLAGQDVTQTFSCSHKGYINWSLITSERKT